MQAKTDRRTLETLHWDNQSLRRLPVLPAGHAGRVDEPRAKVTSPVTPGVTSGVCFSPAAPTPLKHPRLVMVSESALHLLGLNPAEAERRAEAYAECESATSSGRPWLAAWAMANGFCGSQIFGSDTLGVDRITLSLHTWE